jgi:AcrR family transcriptional regulator
MERLGKIKENQKPEPRKPRQERARYKVELMLEAAIRLLEHGGMEVLTTNAVAQTAGVSIGTLYQYFPNKDAILDALAEREMAQISQRVLAALAEASPGRPEENVRRLVSAVTASYGERREAHRQVIAHALARGGRRLTPLLDKVIALLTSSEHPAQLDPPMSAADAFVLTNAFAGVMRAMLLVPEGQGPAPDAIERALARLIAGFVA